MRTDLILFFCYLFPAQDDYYWCKYHIVLKQFLELKIAHKMVVKKRYFFRLKQIYGDADNPDVSK